MRNSASMLLALGLGFIAVPESSFAQCANQPAGPDVIVGSVSGISNYGNVGNMSAYSLGTTSCNVGDAELQWIASSVNHPVIGQNIYRIEDGRFEQIGLSWLKHGFTALQQNLCCNCISSGTGTRLGVGCSDPYGSGLNGSQSGLGPRFQVNAYNGAFSWPYAAQGQTGDRIYKRIQVLNDDVDPALHPNATYIGEAQYVTPDDAAAGNHFNNASWRNLDRPGTLTNGGWRLNTSGGTNRGEPAIKAWEAHGATVTEHRIPGEGAVWVGSNCVDLGGGTYRYEYALFNLNSHFSVGDFSVPYGAGTTISDIGMSFPLYHSGEPYTNTAWAHTDTGSSIEWSTEDFAANSNANAIRWGTTYSFWFTANAVPDTNPLGAHFGLFRPGGPGDQNVGVCGPTGGGGGILISNYCQPNVNSTGFPSRIWAQNYDEMNRTFDLRAYDLPLNANGYFLASTMQDYVQNPGGSWGNICVGPVVGRGVAGGVYNSGATGEFSGTADMDAIPQPTGPVMIMAGETWNFQAWHRDSILNIPGSNFTDGVTILFP